ncbi:MAG: pyridoxamine 5'-phosphate oxidase family protein [Gammaproteobacteria bacterium]
MPEGYLDRVRELISGHSTITLATVHEHMPWAAAVFYASDNDLNLYFVTDLKTRHGRDLHHNAQVAGAINHDVETWNEVIGLQVDGRAFVLEGEERLSALAYYLAKFPDVQRLFEKPRDQNEKVIADRLQRAPFWRLTPAWIRLIDSRKGFGWKWETTL